ncbi:MAG: hypothetical protein Kow0092_26730 [Deferrisomatales bacterium]
MRQPLPAPLRWAPALLVLALSLLPPGVDAAAGRLVRVGVYDYAPVVFRDPEGAIRGFQVELLEHIAREEGWSLEYVFGSWPESLRHLEERSIDLLVGIGYSHERARKYRFNTETVLHNWGQLFTPDGQRIDSLAALAGKRVALYRKGIFSESLRRILTEMGIDCTYLEVKDYDVIFDLLDRRQADAGVIARLYGTLYADEYRVEPTPIIFMPSEIRFAAPLDAPSDLLEAIDRQLLAWKEDPASLYYEGLNRWVAGGIAHAAVRHRFPRWIWTLLGTIAGTALVLAVTNVVLDRKVKRRTAELDRNNERLRREIAVKEAAETALAENERKLATLMDNIPGMVYRCTSHLGWPLDFVSRGSRELLGCDPEELLASPDGRRLWDRIHPDDRAEVEARRAAAVRGGEPYQLLYRMETRSGLFQWVSDCGVGVRTAEGALVALEGVITDITQQQETELHLRRENLKLRSALKDRAALGEIIGRSQPMQEVYEKILKAAGSDDPVVITGESGTGKELVARTVHDMSSRSDGPFVPVNCAAIPENLLESEFFGYRKGAFTGAGADKPGYLDAARGGTLFLDEIGDISPSLQAKLLRALDGGGYTPVGGTRTRTVDLRIVAATNKNLRELVRRGKMREDFYYRIHIIPIRLPPLRDRRSDIPLLVDHFLERYPVEARPPVTPKVMEALLDYSWPGNVRELQNAVKRYAALGEVQLETAAGEIPSPAGPPLAPPPGTADLQAALERFEREHIRRTLEEHGWHRGKAAALLGINRKTLYKKIKALGIAPPASAPFK